MVKYIRLMLMLMGKYTDYAFSRHIILNKLFILHVLFHGIQALLVI